MAERVSGGRKLVRTAVTAVFALGLGGCALKGGQNVSSIEGKTLFIKNCGSCHTLARASSKGLIGPNLDDAFAESISQGLGRNVIGGIVEQQIEYPNTGGRMPKLPLTTRQAADIAAYVQYAAARPGKDPGLLGQIGVSQFGPPATEKNGKLAFAANTSGQLLYTVKAATATAGPVTISMTNMSGTPHNLAIQQGTGATGTLVGKTPISASGTNSITVNLKPGTYTFFCQVTGHRAAGMFGTLTVK
jgi:mono/diheme cytochrome c family protein/plastocyanin